MAVFTVEDGTGLGNATSYVDIPFADSYLGDNWAVDETTKQASLIAATEYFDARWGGLLKGMPLTSIQPLEFPRKSLLNRYNDKVVGIPRDVKRAVCQYALLHSGDHLYNDPTQSLDKIKSKTTVVGPVTTAVTYADSKTEVTGWRAFPLADQLVAQYIASNKSSGQASVMRA